MTFLDSHCHQACPLEGRALAARRARAAGGARPALVVVSVNPRDTPASERAARRELGPRRRRRLALAHGRACTARARLARVSRVRRADGGGDIVHAEALYLIDRRGDERSGYLCRSFRGFVDHDLGLLGDRGAAVSEIAPAIGIRAAAPGARRRAGALADYVTLTKPRIMSLLVLTSVCAMIAAAHGDPAPLRSRRSCSAARSRAAARARSTTSSTATSTG